MKNNPEQKLIDICRILTRVHRNSTGFFSRTPEPIAILDFNTSEALKGEVIHISEFVIAKIKGCVARLAGHPEITDGIFCRLPFNLCNPIRIVKETRSANKYLFIAENPLHLIVIEVRRMQSGKTEINTIYRINREEQRRLEKFPTA